MLKRTPPNKVVRLRRSFTPPAFRPPQLATLQQDVPTADEWLFELSYQGQRCQAAIAGTNVRLYNEQGEDWSEQFGHVIPALSELTLGTLLIDGEICAINDDGRADPALLRRTLAEGGPLVFFAFDLLEQDDEDVGQLPQVERKRRLAALLAAQPVDSPLLYSPHVVGNARKVFEAVRAGGYPGVIAKWPTARYYSGGRSTAWLEIKAARQQAFVVVGWQGSEDGEKVRSLLLATYERGRLVYRGMVETGFSAAARRKLPELLAPLAARRPRLDGMPPIRFPVVNWVRPRLLAEVEFFEILSDGMITRPMFKGLAGDEDARSVHLELTA
jgi:bifunctional non-homologous end joining protein LigD